MRELGINVEEAAIMSAVIPVIGIIMPPLAGMVADKIGNFKVRIDCEQGDEKLQEGGEGVIKSFETLYRT